MTDEQRDLVAKNHNLIYSFLRTYHLSIDEYYDIAALGLCNAAINYKEEIAKFSTYAYQCMLSYVMHEITTQKRFKRIPKEMIYSLNYEPDMEEGKSVSIENMIPTTDNTEAEALVRVMIHQFKEKLKPKQRRIFELLLDGYTQCDIARILGCSRQYISIQKIEIEKKLNKYLAHS